VSGLCSQAVNSHTSNGLPDIEGRGGCTACRLTKEGWIACDSAWHRISRLRTNPTNNPMIPHTIVLEPGLVVFKIYNGYWFFGRPTAGELRQDSRSVSKKCRPDWDINGPGMKSAWDRGEKDRFYPYGKSFAKIFGEQE
jgi:hypothetical protein